MQYEDTILEQLNDIRDLVNIPRRQHLLSGNRELWLKLCSCLDTIADTESAILTFVSRGFGEGVEANYLAIYGLLQALYVQQDATKHLCESLGIEVERNEYPHLTEIRDIRNKSVGHPTKKDRPPPVSFHFITQASLDPDGFELLSYGANGGAECNYYSTSTLIEEQRRFISEILTSVLRKLQDEELTHKREFRMEKLVRIFPRITKTDYWLAKIDISIDTGNPRVSPAGLRSIRQVIQDFREALGRRDPAYHESLTQQYAMLEYAFSELEKFFQSLGTALEDRSRMTVVDEELSDDHKAAYIYAYFVRRQLDEFRRIAQRLDEEYDE